MTMSESLEYHNATVVQRDMPGNAKAFIAKNADGYTIVVNAALGPEEQKKAIKHELNHGNL